MIIFYDKKTGDIVGTVDGRIHTDMHLGMWIGDKEKNDRLVVQWKPVGEDEDGTIYGPDHPQKKLFTDLDRKKKSVSDYRVEKEGEEVRLTRKS